MDEISTGKKVESGVVQKLVAFGTYESRRLVYFLPRVGVKDIASVQTLFSEIDKLLIE